VASAPDGGGARGNDSGSVVCFGEDREREKEWNGVRGERRLRGVLEDLTA
jgi:hypothetical protein